ncbi:carbonic anhydrase, partial [Nonomuraea recticatena]|uniref:carbonic anhydrase n=1 Tax=Nonomuraea recticatena TaxID=46178 RepID=UPI003D1581AC
CSADGGGFGGEDVAARAAGVPALQDLENAEDIWQALLDGNQRWADGAAVHPHADVQWRESLVEGQAPRAAVFSCVDSRVAPELIFDTGVGDIMVTRTAGEVFDPLVSESVSYGPAALEAPLLVVLGHQKCGAVTAAHEALLAAEEGTELEEHEQRLVGGRDRAALLVAEEDPELMARVVEDLFDADLQLVPGLLRGHGPLRGPL